MNGQWCGETLRVKDHPRALRPGSLTEEQTRLDAVGLGWSPQIPTFHEVTRVILILKMYENN